MLELLPATVSPDRVALTRLHAWTEDDFPNVASWGIRSFSPGELRDSTRPLPVWVAAAGCSRVAIHFDVDTIDCNEIVLGLGAEPGGLTSAQVRRIVADIDRAVDVVGFTIAEFFTPAGTPPAADLAWLPAGLRNPGRLTPGRPAPRPVRGRSASGLASHWL